MKMFSNRIIKDYKTDSLHSNIKLEEKDNNLVNLLNPLNIPSELLRYKSQIFKSFIRK